MDIATTPRLCKKAEQLDIKFEIAALKLQMSQMMEMMTLLAAKLTELTEEDVTRPNVPRGSSAAPGKRPTNKDVCLNCGGVGHYQQEYASPWKRTEGWRGPQRRN